MNTPHVINCPRAQTAQLPSCPTQTPEGHLCSASCYQPWLEHIENCVECKNHLFNCIDSKCQGFIILRRGKNQVREMASSMNQGPRHFFPTNFVTNLSCKKEEDWKPQRDGYVPSKDVSPPSKYYVITSTSEGNMRAIRHQPNTIDLFIPEGSTLLVDNLSYNEALELCNRDKSKMPAPIQSPIERRVELTLTMFSLLELAENLEKELKTVGIRFDFIYFIDWVCEFTYKP